MTSRDNSKLTIRLDAETIKQFKIKCLMNNETMTEVIKKFISEYLKEK